LHVGILRKPPNNCRVVTKAEKRATGGFRFSHFFGNVKEEACHFARASSYEIPSPVLAEEFLDDVWLGEVAGPENYGVLEFPTTLSNVCRALDWWSAHSCRKSSRVRP
jgi:hypothetical protein